MNFTDLYVEEVLQKYEYEHEEERDICLEEVFKNALGVTAHIARVTAVTWAAGLCTYAARMMTTIGVKGLMREGIPGKGIDVHKLLALASIDFVERWKNRRDVDVRESVSKAADELRDLINVEELERIKPTAISMLSIFRDVLNKAAQKLSLDVSRLRAYPELELIDYNVHMWGVSDLIIEDAGSKKAVVVEWKSDERSPMEREKVQVYAYAILEALRLGYKNPFDAIVPENPNDTKIYPVIIRPDGPYSDHPLLPIAKTGVEANVEKVRERLFKIVVAAKYLTALLVDFGKLVYGDSKQNYELQEKCKVRLGDGGYYALRLTPVNLPRGNPKQQEKFPCTICPFSDKNSKLGECRFYFGSTEKDYIDKLMWTYRYKVYGERERAAVPFKVLYEVSRKVGGLGRFAEFVERGGGYYVWIANGNIRTMSASPSKNRRKCGIVRVSFEEVEYEDDIRVGVYELEWLGKETLLLRRRFLPCELAEENRLAYVYAPRERQPVLVVIPEDHVSAVTLGASLYARVEYVGLEGDKTLEELGVSCSGGVCVLVTPISGHLRFQFRLFEKYTSTYGVKKVLVAEVGSDLTHIDLQTIHTLHMVLKSANAEETGLEAEELNKVRKTVEAAWREALKEVAEEY